MKKVLIFVIFVALITSLCSCGVESNIDDNTSDTFISGQVINNTEKIFLIAHSESASFDAFINFKDSSKYGLNLISEKKIRSDVQSTIEHPFNNKKQFSYSYSELTPKNSLTMTAGTFYSRYDYYVFDEEKIAILHDSDMVCFYTKPYRPGGEYPVMTESAVKKIADDFLLSIMSENVLSNLKYEGMSTDVLGRYALLYTRYVCGYPTDETISLWVDKSGEVSGYNGYNIKKYDTLVDKIKENDIKLAINSLVSELESLNLTELKKAKPELTTNSDGEIFVSINFSHKANGLTIGETAYVKI